jgi:hypothetical protein
MIIHVKYTDQANSQNIYPTTHMVYPKDTVHSLKLQIWIATAIPVGRQRLIFREKELEGTLSEYNLNEDDTVDCVIWRTARA